MARISLVGQYDNRSVIEQIRSLIQKVKLTDSKADNAVANAGTALEKSTALEPQVADNTSSIAGLDVRIGTNTDSIDSLENHVGTDRDAPAVDGSLYARVKKNTADVATNASNITSVTGRVGSLETRTADAITSAEFTADASTVTSVHKHLDRQIDSDTLPVASSTQAGVINAQDYSAILQMRQDITDLQGTIITYQVNLPSDNPSQAEITTAFTTAYPTVSLVAGIKVADYNRNQAYQYDGSLWTAQQFAGSIPIATSSAVGGVKSSANNGEIAVNVNGTMSLNGYDSITGRLDNIDGTDGRLDSLESADVSMMFEISGIQSDIGSIEGDITAIEGDITNLQTDIGEIQTDILSIEGDVTALQTAVAGKQDALTAGEGISIVNNVISATGVTPIDVSAPLTMTGTNVDYTTPSDKTTAVLAGHTVMYTGGMAVQVNTIISGQIASAQYIYRWRDATVSNWGDVGSLPNGTYVLKLIVENDRYFSDSTITVSVTDGTVTLESQAIKTGRSPVTQKNYYIIDVTKTA